jgi:hypothetical protein
MLAAIITCDAATIAKSCVLIASSLGFIWFGDDLGRYTDGGGGTPAFTKATPGVFIAIFGWGILVATLIAVVAKLWHMFRAP